MEAGARAQRRLRTRPAPVQNPSIRQPAAGRRRPPRGRTVGRALRASRFSHCRSVGSHGPLSRRSFHGPPSPDPCGTRVRAPATAPPPRPPRCVPFAISRKTSGFCPHFPHSKPHEHSSRSRTVLSRWMQGPEAPSAAFPGAPAPARDHSIHPPTAEAPSRPHPVPPRFRKPPGNRSGVCGPPHAAFPPPPPRTRCGFFLEMRPLSPHTGGYFTKGKNE